MLDITPGWCVPCHIESCHDGDTMQVVISKRFTVRLLDCWAPELSTPEGVAARDRIKELVEGRNAYLMIPGGKHREEAGQSPLTEVAAWTFGRVLGRVFVKAADLPLDRPPVAVMIDGVPHYEVAEIAVAEGLASRTKAEQPTPVE